MKITWTIDDGYLNKSRDHTFIIDDQELEDCETEEEKEEYIQECIQEQFEDKVFWYEVRREV